MGTVCACGLLASMYIKRKPLPQAAGTRAPLTRPIVPKKTPTPQQPQPTEEEQLQQLVELRKQVEPGAFPASPEMLRAIDNMIDDRRARLERALKRQKPRSSRKS